MGTVSPEQWEADGHHHAFWGQLSSSQAACGVISVGAAQPSHPKHFPSFGEEPLKSYPIQTRAHPRDTRSPTAQCSPQHHEGKSSDSHPKTCSMSFDPHELYNFSKGSFPQCLFLCLTSGFAFPSFAKPPLSPGHTSEKCQPTSGNHSLKRAHLCYLCVDTLLKEPLDWKHSTGMRNGTSHPAPASSLLLWGMSVGNTTPSLTVNGEIGCPHHQGTKHHTTAFLT